VHSVKSHNRLYTHQNAYDSKLVTRSTQRASTLLHKRNTLVGVNIFMYSQHHLIPNLYTSSYIARDVNITASLTVDRVSYRLDSYPRLCTYRVSPTPYGL